MEVEVVAGRTAGDYDETGHLFGLRSLGGHRLAATAYHSRYMAGRGGVANIWNTTLTQTRNQPKHWTSPPQQRVTPTPNRDRQWY